MAALIPWLTFVALQSIALIPRLAFVAQRTVGGRCNPIFQHLDFNREFLNFHFVASSYFSLVRTSVAGASAAAGGVTRKKIDRKSCAVSLRNKNVIYPLRCCLSDIFTTPFGLLTTD